MPQSYDRSDVNTRVIKKETEMQGL
jgi:hypothetical protein